MNGWTSESKRAVVRAPISGGSSTPVTTAWEFTSLFVDGRDVYISSNSNLECTNRYSETTGAIEGPA